MRSTKFRQSLTLPVTSEEAFAWHERPGALDRLIPPWEKVEIESRGQAAPEVAEEIKALQKQNVRLKKLVADQALDLEILKEAAGGNW